MADPAVGDVDILLDGKEVTLRCSLDAAKQVSAIADGYLGARARLGMSDHNTYVQVVAAGLGKKPSDVDGAVYRTGVINLTKMLVLFVENLANGGKPVLPDEGDVKLGEG